MKLTNNQIYNYASALMVEFGADCNIKLPVKINFFLQKNIQAISALAQEIEKTRLTIAQSYGELNESGSAYSVPEDKIMEVQNELNDLFSLEQDVAIHTFNIDDFANVELTYKQMNALMFMIEE